MSTSRKMSWQACAACKHQRRKCYPNCPLARYFPPERAQEFVNVHRVFGVSNLIKMCNDVAPEHRDAFMDTIIYEAEMRRKDPVHGSLKVVNDLSGQISCMKEELEAIQREIMFHKIHEKSAPMMNQQLQFGQPPVLSSSVKGNELNGGTSNFPSLTIEDIITFDQAQLNISNMPQFYGG